MLNGTKKREFSVVTLTGCNFLKIDYEGLSILKYKISGFEEMLSDRHRFKSKQRDRVIGSSINLLVGDEF